MIILLNYSIQLFYKISNENSISHVPALMLTFNKKFSCQKSSGHLNEKTQSLAF